MLSFAIQEPAEFHEWLEILAETKPRFGLEIGTYEGGSACLMLEALPKLKRLVTVDIVDRGPGLPPETAPYRDRMRFVQGDSHTLTTRDAVVRALGGKPLDFAFIDGHHAYESVTSDFFLYAPLVRSGGLVALHDINSVHVGYDHTAGVARFWDELCAREPGRCHGIRRRFGIGVYRR